MPDLFTSWFDQQDRDDVISVFTERNGGRALVLESLIQTVADHLVDLEVIEKMGGFTQSQHVLKHRLPQRKTERSGDLGEILATEYISQKTSFAVPIKRLRFKDDRGSAMRGDDVIAIQRTRNRTKVLKAEAKSRAALAGAVIEQARDGLGKYRGRPNPSTLAFIEYLLRKEDRDAEAEIFKSLQQSTIRARDVAHLIFTLSGNNPSTLLASQADPIQRGISLQLCGCRVADHGAFVASVFEGCGRLGDEDGEH